MKRRQEVSFFLFFPVYVSDSLQFAILVDFEMKHTMRLLRALFFDVIRIYYNFDAGGINQMICF